MNNLSSIEICPFQNLQFCPVFLAIKWSVCFVNPFFQGIKKSAHFIFMALVSEWIKWI